MFYFKNENFSYWHLVLPIVIFFSFYFGIGSYPLFDNNEGLYSSIGKYMLLNKSFVIPYLNCVPYIEKPPLLYWLLSLSFSFFGITAFAARFVTTTCAVLLCLALVRFGEKIKQSQVGVTSAVIFSSSIGVSIVARMVYFDMLFTLLITVSLLMLFYWYEIQKKSVLRIAYIFVGLAVLAKGLIAIILIGGSFLAFLISEKSFRKCFTKLLDPMAILLFLAVVLPWHIAAAIKHKGFAWHYFVEEHFLRFLSKREPHDYYQGPIYYYIPRIVIYLFPWSLLTPLLFWRTRNLSILEQKLLRFSWCWVLVPLLFFSFSQAKANYYMVISAPAIAIIFGVKIKELFLNQESKAFNIWTGIILLVIGIGLGTTLLFFAKPLKIIGITKLFVAITIVYCYLAGLISLIFGKKPVIAIIGLSCLVIPLVLTMISYVKTIQNEISAANVGLYLSAHGKDKELYLYQDFEDISALAFYAPGCFKIIDTQSSDLYYGAHLSEFKSIFVSKKEFPLKLLTNSLYIVIPNKKLPEFYKKFGKKNFSVGQQFDNLTVVGVRHLQSLYNND